MSQLEALLFDVDGTLADTERDGHRVAFNLAFADAGLDWEWSEELYGKLLAVTGGKERIRYYLDNYNTEFKRPDDLDEFIAGLHKAKTAHYVKLLSNGVIPLRSGVRRLIDEARAAGLRLAVSTTTTPANVEALLENALAPGSMAWFEVIAAGDIVPAKKPAPDIYDYAMEQMGLKPEQCIAFEDSYNGIRSSLGAKLKTIVAVNGYTRDEDFEGAEIILNEWGEPDAPFEVINGDANGSNCLDLEMVRRLHGG
ncbi:phosphatase [Solemya pervernicosa gill symbiont]|uniref:Phosphatase n=2 Tax=Gammaproteobacteria incertae sedis TaxID=118884 RepID=A0A1T2L173_9GAMM|nr:HAD family hydrolase [Candidatus Reidiella endopervernicosa]OOZ38853.1 phosphatase [Solemya pervernicosa gill symbiont]QKQ26567.1 HAD family hydrolase [Candidatus Reidiella endopervernicosa]